ncbi:hypothetical protein CASFOL_012990 [Castilleja foliolosa]|uniref:Plant thionin family protein n=1 Tax=Castilleja foliolosa TaxID=1961234 RepID=A0ABD3DMR5_9LAMI
MCIKMKNMRMELVAMMMLLALIGSAQGSEPKDCFISCLIVCAGRNADCPEYCRSFCNQPRSPTSGDHVDKQRKIVPGRG